MRQNIYVPELHKHTRSSHSPRLPPRCPWGPSGTMWTFFRSYVFSYVLPSIHRTPRPCCQAGVLSRRDAPPKSLGGHVRSFLLSCWPHIKVKNTYFKTPVLFCERCLVEGRSFSGRPENVFAHTYALTVKDLGGWRVNDFAKQKYITFSFQSRKVFDADQAVWRQAGMNQLQLGLPVGSLGTNMAEL